MAQEQFYPQNPNSNLQPLHTALGVNPDHVTPRGEILMLREGWSWGGDQFHINTVEGREVIKMSARVMSMSNRKGTYSLFHFLFPSFFPPSFLPSYFPCP
jgi:hypothetical protein